MSRILYEPLGIIIFVFVVEIKFIVRFVHVRYRMISLKDLKDQTELVVVVTQLYNRKIVCREDIALPAQRKYQRYYGKSVR